MRPFTNCTVAIFEIPTAVALTSPIDWVARREVTFSAIVSAAGFAVHAIAGSIALWKQNSATHTHTQTHTQLRAIASTIPYRKPRTYIATCKYICAVYSTEYIARFVRDCSPLYSCLRTSIRRFAA